ncbi:DUF21 domain-containing protein-like protein, partial [Tanacetum coccineum]
MTVEYHWGETEFFVHIGIIVLLVLFAGLMSGLTLGLMSMSLVDLEVLAKSGTPNDRKYAVIREGRCLERHKWPYMVLTSEYRGGGGEKGQNGRLNIRDSYSPDGGQLRGTCFKILLLDVYREDTTRGQKAASVAVHTPYLQCGRNGGSSDFPGQSGHSLGCYSYFSDIDTPVGGARVAGGGGRFVVGCWWGVGAGCGGRGGELVCGGLEIGGERWGLVGWVRGVGVVGGWGGVGGYGVAAGGVGGGIIPQSVCARHGLAIGAAVSPFVRVLVCICFPVAYPISKLLDHLLGHEHVALFRRAELKTLVNFHGNEAGKGGELTHDETTIIAGALELSDKTASDAMTPISDTFTIDINAKLDRDLMNVILEKGHSRIPVYYEQPTNIIGLILVKNLLTIQTDEEVPVKNVTIRRIP